MVEITVSADRILGLAALVRPEASGLSVPILTVQTGAIAQSANGRMPAIIGEEDYEAWLDDTRKSVRCSTSFAGLATI